MCREKRLRYRITEDEIRAKRFPVSKILENLVGKTDAYKWFCDRLIYSKLIVPGDREATEDNIYDLVAWAKKQFPEDFSLGLGWYSRSVLVNLYMTGIITIPEDLIIDHGPDNVARRKEYKAELSNIDKANKPVLVGTVFRNKVCLYMQLRHLFPLPCNNSTRDKIIKEHLDLEYIRCVGHVVKGIKVAGVMYISAGK